MPHRADLFDKLDVLRKLARREGVGPAPSPEASLAPWRRLAEISALLNSTAHDFETTCATILDVALQVTSARRGYLLLYDEAQQLQTKVTRSRADHSDSAATEQQDEDYAWSRTVIQRVERTARPLYSTNLTEDSEFREARSILELRLLGALCVPLLLRSHAREESSESARPAIEPEALGIPRRGDLIGLLYVDGPLADTGFGLQDLDFFQALGDQAATAILNSFLFDHFLKKEQAQHALQLARDVQRRLLPLESPRCPGLEVYGVCHPCEETGGDYYDFIPLADGRLGIALGDVSGHGVGPALVMATGRAFLQAYARREVELRTLFADLNNRIHRDTDRKMFMTLFYGILEPRSGRFTYLNAGQDPPLLYRHGEDRAEFLPSGGIALGVLPEYDFGEPQHLELEPGDLLLHTTDGVSEAMNTSREFFGRERIMAVLKGVAGEAAETIVSRLAHAVASFAADAPQHDDRTILCVKRLRA